MLRLYFVQVSVLMASNWLADQGMQQCDSGILVLKALYLLAKVIHSHIQIVLVCLLVNCLIKLVLPYFVLNTGHRNWILCTSWSPNCKYLASGCKNGEICIWDSTCGKQKGKTLVGHKQWVTSLAWEPIHLNSQCRYEYPFLSCFACFCFSLLA